MDEVQRRIMHPEEEINSNAKAVTLVFNIRPEVIDAAERLRRGDITEDDFRKIMKDLDSPKTSES